MEQDVWDFIVIGGGIAGVSAAARLSALGSVALLEGETALGYHASGRSAALYEANYGKASTVALNIASRSYHETADGGVLSPRGLMLITSAEKDAHFEHDRTTMKLDEISLTDALHHWPILRPERVTRAAYDAQAEDIDTDRLLQSFANTLRKNGGSVLTSQTVTGLHRDGGLWTISSTTRTLRARIVVNAAGAWADQVAVMAGIAPLGLTPLRRSMARVPAPDGHDVTHWPMLFGPGEDWYSKPDAGALLVSPADEDPVEPHDAYADDLVLAEGLARFEENVVYNTPRLLASWAGLRTFSPDRTLVLGPDRHESSFIWCAGQGGYGVQSAPAASQLLADLASGRQSDLDLATIADLSPNRFS